MVDALGVPLGATGSTGTRRPRSHGDTGTVMTVEQDG